MKGLKRKLFWVRAEKEGSLDGSILSAALEAGAEALLVPSREAERAREKGVIKIITEELVPQTDILLCRVPSPTELGKAESLAEEARKRGKETALLVEIRDKETEGMAVKAARGVDYLVVWGKDWKIIPLENLIAALHGRGRLLALVKSAEEAKIALETLELGADGILLDPEAPLEVKKTGEVIRGMGLGRVELIPAKVIRVKAVGSGDRACVDTCSILREGEGMLVGSQAEGMFLVHSETLKSEFVETRPFRVNAGAVHGYIMVPGGKTKYLSELSSGEEVLVVDTSGRARAEVVGRVKIERRPLVLVEAEVGGRNLKVVLQNAETINLVGKDGKPISVTKLREGDEVLVHLSGKGRHFGMAVEEFVIER
ncbi:MAG: 3-dehydroquinate synthase II [Candidatus Hadarchaeales archaeon]